MILQFRGMGNNSLIEFLKKTSLRRLVKNGIPQNTLVIFAINWVSARIRSPKGNKHTMTQIPKELQEEQMILTPETMRT
jgi:hypothetical protein